MWKAFDFYIKIGMRVLLGGVFLVVVSCLSSLGIYHDILFWFVEFLLRNQLINLSGFPLYVVLLFSLVAFNILCLLFYVFNFCQFDYCVSWCVPPWVYPAWDTLCFLDFADFFLSHVGEVFSFCLFKYFLRCLLSSPLAPL